MNGLGYTLLFFIAFWLIVFLVSLDGINQSLKKLVEMEQVDEKKDTD